MLAPSARHAAPLFGTPCWHTHVPHTLLAAELCTKLGGADGQASWSVPVFEMPPPAVYFSEQVSWNMWQLHGMQTCMETGGEGQGQCSCYGVLLVLVPEI